MVTRDRLRSFVDSSQFQNFTLSVIVFNAITLGLETSDSILARWGDVLYFFDRAAIAWFTVEVSLRIAAHGRAFFRTGWGWFDFIIVAVSLMPQCGAFSVLRSLRILRVLRLFSMVPSLRRVVGALMAAIPGMASIAMVLSILFYVSAVIATKLFGNTFPDWFGSLGASLYTLFQIMTLESWSMGIVRPVLAVHDWAWVFFVPFIVVTSFAVLNLFIGVIVSALQSISEESKQDTFRHELLEVNRKLDQLISQQPKAGG